MLARAGQRGITITDSPACLADLQVLEARALASGGAGAAVVARTVTRAENTFSQVKPVNEPEWARFIDPAYLFGEAAHCFRDVGDAEQIERFATDSAADAARQKRARRGALSEAALTIADLVRDQPDAAASRGLEVVRLTKTVNSSRCVETVRDLVGRFRPYEDLDPVQEFLASARDVLVPAA